MYDFINFIDALNKKADSFNDALDLVKNDFHIGKIFVKSDNLLECLEYNASNDYLKTEQYKCNYDGFDYYFYQKNDGYKFSDEEKNDIAVLMKILALYFNNYILKKQAEESEYLSPETKLLNAKGYFRKIAMLLSKYKASEFNAYFINLKGFGFINRIYNYQIGDLVLSSYANKLKEFAQEDDAIAHLGGDNFVAFLKKKRHQEFVDLVSNVPVTIKRNGENISLTLIGVIGYENIENDNYDLRSAISSSTIACQYAKATKKPIVMLTDDLLSLFLSIRNIEHTFKDELKKGNFLVYYQPKFDISSRKIIGVEALARWVSDGKIVPPSMFVPVLEKNGDIVELDMYMLETLCKDIHNYRNQGNKIVPASCNLSGKDFEHDDLEQRIINIIKKYNVKTEDIVIEVTETTNFEENERLARFINEMWRNGIMTSIDDFGTGYSSLSVLRDFKVNEIKIDRSFINREVLSESDEIIISSIINMAKKLNINVICEGVETKKQADFLAKYGCFRAQGFYYSKPVPKLEFEAMLKEIGTVYD